MSKKFLGMEHLTEKEIRQLSILRNKRERYEQTFLDEWFITGE